MAKDCTLVLSPKQAQQTEIHKKLVSKKLRVDILEISEIVLVRKSIDSRQKSIKIHLKYQVFFQGEKPDVFSYEFKGQNVSQAQPILVIGTGPAGLFAGLKLIEYGFKPILIERGKDVVERRKDLGAINRDHIVNPDSNYCFGEGGAGTYSDGKLYTRSYKRGNIQETLEILVHFGAHTDILSDAHPHIGTNKLPKIIAKMRDTIMACGGEVLFDTRMEDIITEGDEFKAIVDQNGNKIEGKACILATGHSARDVYQMFYDKKWMLEAKPFALGVRVEHPQPIIDQIQYHCDVRSPYLPAASYALVQQVKGLGVYSFCMCPGGHMVPAATAQEEVVVNGMSTSTRSSKYANSGIVVSIDPQKLKGYQDFGVFSALQFQKDIERKAWIAGGKSQKAPAQRMTDFCENKFSNALNEGSYIPGLTSTKLDEVLPSFVSERLKSGFKAFGRKMKGYYTQEANVVGVESRTSAPISIPRNKETLEHPQVKGLYPCGEGAGYAGGIISAALDGIRCAQAISNKQ
ncbi:MAG: NAD(P)/FAD-dependent oxidoreductase [Flavobacteriales bacterium]